MNKSALDIRILPQELKKGIGVPKHLHDVFYIRFEQQGNKMLFFDCGITSVFMIDRFHNIDRSLGKVKHDNIHVERSSTSSTCFEPYICLHFSLL